MSRSISINSKRQKGLSLIELVVAMAMSALVIAPMIVILDQFFGIPIRASSTNNLINDVQQAAFQIADDARSADSFVSGSSPVYGTFSWVDRTGLPIATHSVRYLHSSGDNSLLREETINAGSPTTEVIARTIKNESDITIQQSGDLIQASITATTGSSSDQTTRSGEISALLRPTSPSAQSTPPPHRLAWDDFDSGDFTGGDGWLGDWLDQGDVDFVASGQGTFYMRLQRNSARAERSLDLTGQTNVRIQFQAKAVSFDPAETVLLEVSDDLGNNFTTVRTWVDGEDDDIFRSEDIDISLFTMTDEFFIAFETTITNPQGEFFVDDLKVVRSWSE